MTIKNVSIFQLTARLLTVASSSPSRRHARPCHWRGECTPEKIFEDTVLPLAVGYKRFKAGDFVMETLLAFSRMLTLNF